MPLSNTTRGRENEKFLLTSNDKTAVRVATESTDPLDVTDSPNTSGTTIQFNSTATAAGVTLPDVAGNDIFLSLVINQETKINRNLEFSFDGGTIFTEIKSGGFVGWPPKGSVTQVVIRRTASTSVDVDFDLILNRLA